MSIQYKKAQLEAILSAIGEGVIIIDLNRKVTYQNERAIEMFGDFTGKSCFSIYQSDGTPCENCPATRAMQADSVRTDVHSRISDDGSVRYYELTAAPVKEDGEIIASVEIVRDITERKVLEEELTRTTRRLNSVINRMKSGLLYANRRDEVAIGNDLALEFFGVTRGEKLSDEADNKNRKMLNRVIDAFRNDAKVSYYEKSVERGDTWYNVRFSVSRSESGAYYGTIANIIDITGMKNLEGLKEDLTHMIVHDMKHPLNTILYVLELAAEGMCDGIDETNNELFLMAHKDSKILLNMIQGMLDISKMQEGEQVIDKKEVYYRQTIASAIGQVDFLGKARGVAIRELYETDKVVLDIDSDYIERVVINLLSNAIKFSKSNSEIIVKVEDDERDGSKFVKVSVINEGPDIPDAAIRTIFEKYKQAEHRASGKIAATGLGLTFCQLAVRSHGGEIWVTSPPEEFTTGAKFSFTLPV